MVASLFRLVPSPRCEAHLWPCSTSDVSSRGHFGSVDAVLRTVNPVHRSGLALCEESPGHGSDVSLFSPLTHTGSSHEHLETRHPMYMMKDAV